MGGHSNLLTHDLKVKLVKEICYYRLERNISALELSAKTGLPEGVFKRIDRLQKVDFFTLTKILFAMDKWFDVILIDRE